MKTQPFYVALIVVLTLLAYRPLEACTGGALIAADGSVAVGRTLEFGTPLNSNISVIPVGTLITGKTPNGDPGLTFRTRYGLLGATAGNSHDAIVDGINDQGLNAALFYFPGYAGYSEATADNIGRGLAPYQFVTWLLAKYATVDEVKAALADSDILIFPVVLDLLKIVPDVHFKVQDATGASIVIEPVDGKLNVYDNPVRVLTNSPGFPFMLTYLNQFLNLTAAYPADQTIDSLKLSAFGMGGGAVGLPGDFSPPSRFVRMVFFTQNHPQPPSSEAAVASLFHLLNNFDIPYGSNHPPASTPSADSDFTTWTSVSDLAKKRFHWKTYGYQTVRVVDLAQALEVADGRVLMMPMGPQTHSDVSPSVMVNIQP
jgi:choloylglycine hydrolase